MMVGGMESRLTTEKLCFNLWHLGKVKKTNRSEMKMRNKGNINLSFPGTRAKFRINDFAENQIGLFVVNEVG